MNEQEQCPECGAEMYVGPIGATYKHRVGGMDCRLNQIMTLRAANERLTKREAEYRAQVQHALGETCEANYAFLRAEQENNRLQSELASMAERVQALATEAEAAKAENARLRETLTTALGELQHHADQECYCHDGEHPGTCSACTARAVIQVCNAVLAAPAIQENSDE